MTEEQRPVKVNILGKEYPIACSPDEQHDLLVAARDLDSRMRKIRDSGRIIGTERIAVLAALNLAYELQIAQAELHLLHQRHSQTGE